MQKNKKSLPQYPGVLISLEGGEGAGKTTQAKKIAQRLQKAGWPVMQTYEPGGTEAGQRARRIVLDTEDINIAYTTEALLFQASRAQLYDEIIEPALKDGQVVLIDRTSDSSLVYQGMVRGLGIPVIRQLNNFSTKNIIPNLTVLLDIKPEEGLERRKSDTKFDRLDKESLNFHRRIRAAYRRLAKNNDHHRWQIIDAGRPFDQVTDDLYQIIEEFLKKQKIAPNLSAPSSQKST